MGLLYDRDYTKLSDKELKQVQKIENKHTISVKAMLKIPEIYFFYKSYFPNNMLDIKQLNSSESHVTLNKFKLLLDDSNISERDIIAFVRERKSYFLIASVLSKYDFGHHSAFIFPEFPLAPNYVVDYLVIGKNSGGHEFVFVELESVYGNVTMKDGALGECIRKGIKQTEDWEFWLESNFNSLRPLFEKYKNKNENLPIEFFEFDKSRVHYVVIAGRRKDFTPVTYRKRRKSKNSNLSLLHYDNLIDCAESVMKSRNYV